MAEWFAAAAVYAGSIPASAHGKRSIIVRRYARVVELVDTRTKIPARKGVPVQVRLRVPLSYMTLNIRGVKINEFC